MQTSQQLTFGHLLATLKAGGALPDSALLVELSEPDPDKEAVVLGHKTTAPSVLPEPTTHAAVARLEAAVHLVAKSGRNPFDQMVTIGRASNNDIVVRDECVSKFHAYFRLGGQTARLFDSSSNGTEVDGRAVGAEGIAPSTLSRIRFGPGVEFFYVAAPDVKEWLAALVPPSEPGSNAWALYPAKKKR